VFKKILVALVALVGIGIAPSTAQRAHAAAHNFDGVCVRIAVNGTCYEIAVGPHVDHPGGIWTELNCRDGVTPCKSWVVLLDDLPGFRAGSCANLANLTGDGRLPYLTKVDRDCDGLEDSLDLSLPAGQVSSYQVAGPDAVLPADISGVALNVTVVGAKAAGFLTVFPCGQPTPQASNLNYNANGVIPNLVIVSPGTGGQVCFYNSAALDLIVDVAGYFGAGSGYVVQATPRRAIDTRGKTRVGGTVIQEIAVGGVFGVPTEAVGVALNVTITGAASDGFATVFPCGQPTPAASNVNYVKGQDIPNFVIARPGVGGKVCVFSSASADVIVDVSGYFAAGTGFTATAAPVRFLDSRESTRIAAGTSKELTVAGDKGIPADAKAMAMNVTAVGASADGFLTVYPCGQPVPVASNLNYTKGRDIANSVLAKPGVGGKVCFYSDKAVDIVVDVSGYFGAASGFMPVGPFRDVDTRSGGSSLQLGPVA
jgi:hypothetical protein